jgi:integrase/recombinase XerD
MRVQRVLMPGSGEESWTLLGDDHVPVGPAERFLSYMASAGRSPNTVKAYAHDLKDWLTYLAGRQRDWQAATLEDVAGFVAWLRLPPAARGGMVAVLPMVEHHCSAASVNRKLAALSRSASSMPGTGLRWPDCWSRCSPQAAAGRRGPTSRSCTTSPRTSPSSTD